MMKLVVLGLQLAIPIVSWLFRRSENKTEYKKKIIQLAIKLDEKGLKNEKLRREYDILLKDYIANSKKRIK